MAVYLYNRIIVNGWISPHAANDPENIHGVLVRRNRGEYYTAPNPVHNVLLGAVIRLNLSAAITMRPRLLDGILMILTEGQTQLQLKDGSQIQIIESLSFAHPTTVKKYQYACICRQERLLLVWHDEIQNVLNYAQFLEEKLLALVSYPPILKWVAQTDFGADLGHWQSSYQYCYRYSSKSIQDAIRPDVGTSEWLCYSHADGGKGTAGDHGGGP